MSQGLCLPILCTSLQPSCFLNLMSPLPGFVGRGEKTTEVNPSPEEEGLLGGRTLDAQNLCPFKAATTLVRLPGPVLIWGGRKGISRRSVRFLRRGIFRLQISILGSIISLDGFIFSLC